MLSRKRFSGHWRWKFIIVCSILLLFVITLIFYSENKRNSRLKNKKFAKRYKTILFKHDHLPADQLNEKFQLEDFEHFTIADQYEVTKKSEVSPKCFHLSNCFNYDKCVNRFSVYVYPYGQGEYLSEKYLNILNIIKSSIYYTENPSEACLYILSLDTLDRDILSKDFVKHVKTKLSYLDLWNNGENHLVLNLFSGTWPLYLENLSFNVGKAIIAKASFSIGNIRQGFDISLPLLPKDTKTEESSSMTAVNIDKNSPYMFPIFRKYLLSFKGKRYLFGIGSETRNALHTISNGNDIILLTTCKHGKNWEKYADERCADDNEDYTKYDYDDLLKNSTFCLVPRGRRLGSFRFLEVIQYGCIPVLLSNGWELPFQDVIDWSKFSLNVDERLLLQLPAILRSLAGEQILAMRQHTLFIYKTYFSSTEVIIHTMLEELRERIMPNIKHSYVLWNHPPGAINIDASFSVSADRYPFYGTSIQEGSKQKFTAIVVAMKSSPASLFALIQAINFSEFVDQILVVWLASSGVPDRRKWPRTRVTLRVVHPPKKTMNARYINMDIIQTDAIFSFDDDVVINSAEIDFAFSVWLSNPDRLVGFTTASHTSNHDEQPQQYKYTSKLMNDYSIVHTSSAIFHKYYSHHYSNRISKKVHEIVDEVKTCESLAMNFLISKLTNKAPMKIAHSPNFKPANCTKERLGVSFTSKKHFELTQKCFGLFIKIFNGLPLVKSKLKMNPMLYHDPVSKARKKYKKLE